MIHTENDNTIKIISLPSPRKRINHSKVQTRKKQKKKKNMKLKLNKSTELIHTQITLEHFNKGKM